jgi:hypothetical protein
VSVVLTVVGLVVLCLLNVCAYGMVRVWVLPSVTSHICEWFQKLDFHFRQMCHLKCFN